MHTHMFDVNNPFTVCGIDRKHPTHAFMASRDINQVDCLDCLRTLANDDTRPHSRACGVKPHNHGKACHTNCPTCHGGE